MTSSSCELIESSTPDITSSSCEYGLCQDTCTCDKEQVVPEPSEPIPKVLGVAKEEFRLLWQNEEFTQQTFPVRISFITQDFRKSFYQDFL